MSRKNGDLTNILL